jgi:hypothetical protein
VGEVEVGGEYGAAGVALRIGRRSQAVANPLCRGNLRRIKTQDIPCLPIQFARDSKGPKNTLVSSRYFIASRASAFFRNSGKRPAMPTGVVRQNAERSSRRFLYRDIGLREWRCAVSYAAEADVVRIARNYKAPRQSVPGRSARSKPAASANARKSRSRVRRVTPLSMQLWAIKASPRRALRRCAKTLARNTPARCQ